MDCNITVNVNMSDTRNKILHHNLACSVKQLDVCIEQKYFCNYFEIWYDEWNRPWLYSQLSNNVCVLCERPAENTYLSWYTAHQDLILSGLGASQAAITASRNLCSVVEGINPATEKNCCLVLKALN